MKTIPGFPNYAITTDGRVWSKPRKRTKGGWLKSRVGNHGYMMIGLFVNSHKYVGTIHRLVLETYVGPCPAGMECRHLNGVRTDNRLENIQWATLSKNQQDRIQHGTTNQGVKNSQAKLNNSKVRVIRYLYKAAKFTLSDLAWQFDVNVATIRDIIQRRTWKHINA